MLEDEHACFIIFPLFLTERGFILANAISRNDKNADFCYYTLNISGESYSNLYVFHMILIISLQYKIRQLNKQLSRMLIEIKIAYQPFSRVSFFFVDMNYLFNLPKPRITL